MKIKDRVKPKVPTVVPGVYMAVCVGIIDLGEQYSEAYKSFSNKVKFVWALPSETIEIDGKVEEKQLSREFSVATKETSKLRGFLSSWNSKKFTDEEFAEFELFDMIGKTCMLNVVTSTSGEYANVESIMPIPNGLPVPASKTATFRWDMDNWDDEAFKKLPEWTQDQIKKSTQYQKEHPSTETIQVETGEPAILPVATTPQVAPQAGTGGVPF